MDAGDVNAGVGDEAMILKGSQRAGAKQLSTHLLNERDNDHVALLELRGFIADNLPDALSEAHAISKATNCKQFMFSLSLNPPQDHVATEDDFLDAADRAESALGLNDQPRAIVIHEKEGRRHAHVVWSRIDADEMKAINLPHFKNKLRDLSRDLFLDHGWVLPDGLATYGNKSPLNFTLDEWQQAKRQGIDPREIKQAFQQAWERCDSQIGFENALEDRGYFLARGDRRGFVALDIEGNIYSIAKFAGIKAKDIRDKLGSPENLPSVDETQSTIRQKTTDQMRSYVGQIKDQHERDMEPLREQHKQMKQVHRSERKKLKDGQGQRWIEETKARSDRLNKGLRGLFDRLSGKAKIIRSQNETSAFNCIKRDRAQRDRLVVEQMKERRALQREFQKLRQKNIEKQKQIAQNFRRSFERSKASNNRSRSQYKSQTLTL